MEDQLFIMFNKDTGEEEFFFNALKPTDIVLEYGAGGSTLEIAKRVKEVYSIEHDQHWYDRVKSCELPNVHLYHVPKNEEEAPGHDGTEEQFYDYVHFPEKLGIRFDVALIDGRCRPMAAKVASTLLQPGGLIFIHDYRHPTPQYRRHEYEVVEEFLEMIDGVYALYKFRVK